MKDFNSMLDCLEKRASELLGEKMERFAKLDKSKIIACPWLNWRRPDATRENIQGIFIMQDWWNCSDGLKADVDYIGKHDFPYNGKRKDRTNHNLFKADAWKKAIWCDKTWLVTNAVWGNGTFDYGYRDFRPSGSPSEIFRVDMHNQQFIHNLRSLLNDCVAWTNWYDPEGSITKGTFHGLTGDYTYVFRADDTQGEDDVNKDSSVPSKMRRLVLEIQLFPGDVAQGHPEKTIHEPKALLSILDSLDEIQKSYQAAVDQKKQQQIASEKESQDLANRQVAAEKTASERRLNEFKAQQEAQLRDNQKNDEIAAIKTAEETKKQEIVEQVAKEKVKEINDFLATPNGKVLVGEIGKFQAKADKLSARDHARIDALTENVQKVAQTYVGTSELEERMRIARDELQLAWNTYHDSPELVELKQTINEKKMAFLKASGYTYDDAMQVLASAEKTQPEK